MDEELERWLLKEWAERLPRFHAQPLAVRAELERRAVRWEYATYMIYEPYPHYFKVGNTRPGRRTRERKETDGACEYGFDALGRLCVERPTQRSGYRKHIYLDYVEHGFFKYYIEYWAEKSDIYLKGSGMQFSHIVDGKIQSHISRWNEEWHIDRYYWNNDRLAKAEHYSTRPHQRDTFFHYDSAGLARIEVSHRDRPSFWIAWRRPDLRPAEGPSRDKLRELLLDRTPGLVAKAAAERPVRRVALVVTTDGSHEGSMPPGIFVGTGAVGTGAPNHWAFADYGIAIDMSDPDVVKAAEQFNITDWKNPGRLSGRLTAEVAAHFNEHGFGESVALAPDFVCFAATPEGRPISLPKPKKPATRDDQPKTAGRSRR